MRIFQFMRINRARVYSVYNGITEAQIVKHFILDENGFLSWLPESALNLDSPDSDLEAFEYSLNTAQITSIPHARVLVNILESLDKIFLLNDLIDLLSLAWSSTTHANDWVEVGQVGAETVRTLNNVKIPYNGQGLEVYRGKTVSLKVHNDTHRAVLKQFLINGNRETLCIVNGPQGGLKLGLGGSAIENLQIYLKVD